MNVYIEEHFKQKSSGEYKHVEVKIDEDLIPWGVARFLERRYGAISELSFHFIREALTTKGSASPVAAFSLLVSSIVNAVSSLKVGIY